MSETPDRTVETEEPDEEKDLFVVDPDDYQKTKKLEAIYKSKKHVRKTRQDDPGLTDDEGWEAYRAQVGKAVADYGNELLPIIEDARERGVISEEDLETSVGPLREFVRNDGRIVNHEEESVRAPRQNESMVFYRQLERIQRKLGLGLDIEEDQGPAEI